MIEQIDARWVPRWVSHLGCIKGCLDYLNLDASDAWLYGATGHAFIINMHEEVCPSGPTAWHTEMLFKLGRNIGYAIDGVFGSKSHGDFGEKQRLAWDRVRRAIDQGLPGYGWELEVPEFYVVYGYDDAGYYYSGPNCDAGKGPKPWQELGDSEIGVLEMCVVKPGQAADDATTVREALALALEHAKSPEKWIFPKYKAGLAGFDLWIHALETGTADAFGMAYNSAVWSECRGYAVQFLAEARERVGDGQGAPFDQAIAHYTTVSESLNKVVELYPFPPKGEEMKEADRCDRAIELLREARVAEEAGLGALEAILAAL